MKSNSSNKTVNILNIPFQNTSEAKFFSIITHRINNHINTFVVTANPEIVMYAQSNRQYERIIQNADYIVADGIGIIIGSKIIKEPLPERVTGYDLFIKLLKWGDEHQKSAYFIGAKPAVIKKLQSIIISDYPGLTISGSHDGYFSDESEIIADITIKDPDMIFVATGYPKQERLIAKNRHVANGLWMGIGGSFDVLTGTVKRAPKKWQQLHLEWLYRVIKEPSRIARLTVLPKYLFQVIHQRISK